jgi:hypothetical protein
MRGEGGTVTTCAQGGSDCKAVRRGVREAVGNEGCARPRQGVTVSTGCSTKSQGEFSSKPVFASENQLQYVRSHLKPISSETGLRDFERQVVEIAVETLVEEASLDPMLRDRLGLQGTVTFESHTNLGPAVSDSLSNKPAEPPAVSKACRGARGKGNRADQFCIYQTSDGQNVPALAIEYKAPHKLSIDQLVTGLQSDIQPDRDVIDKEGEGFPFVARTLAAAVIIMARIHRGRSARR